jgi:hypothetical protein
MCISTAGFEQIEAAGGINLTDELRAEIADVVNSYILRTAWDRNSRPSHEEKVHLQALSERLHGMLDGLVDLNVKFEGEGAFHPGIALSDQCLFHRAGIDPLKLYDDLLSLQKAIEQHANQAAQGGRPKDFFLPQFFCELEEIFLKAGGVWVGVTKTLEDTRRSPFADFVNAILRFAPAGIGPSSSPGVAVAWERQLRSRRAFNR